MVCPPEHLRSEIQRCRQDFDLLIVRILHQILSPASLRPDVSMEGIMELFRQFQDFINIRYQTEVPFARRPAICLRAAHLFDRKEKKHI